MRHTRTGITTLLLIGLIAGCAPLPDIGLKPRQTGIFAAAPEAPSTAIHHIKPQRAEDIDELARLGMDIFSVQHGQVEGRANAAALDFARRRGLTVNTISQAMGGFGQGQGLPSGFMSYEAITARLQTIAKQHPDLATLVDLGPSWQTVQGQAARKIWALRLSAGGNGNKPKALFTAGQHARELAPPEIAMRLIDELTGSYGKDARITKILDTREAWIVPLVNPDGRVEVEKGSTMWRKNRHIFDFTRAIGVDLNRNFDSYWHRGETNPGSETYRGEAAFSEPETRGIRDLYRREKFTVSMDYHAYGNVVIWPPGWERGYTPDQQAFARIGKAITKSNGYRADTIANGFYIANGSICDWAYEEQGVMAFCTEMGSSFRPSASELPRLYAQNREGALHLLEIADNPKGSGVPAIATR